MDVHCERCGTSYALDETRIGEGGARVRCARCGHVFLVPKSSGSPQAGAAVVAGPSGTAEASKREWRVRRRDGSISSLRELTTLQRWIVEGKLLRADEVGLDGENWRPLGSIADLEPFFVAADARDKVAALEEEVARLKASAPAAETRAVPSAPLSVPEAPPPPAARPRAPTVAVPAAALPAAVSVAPAAPTSVPATPEEPAFTRTKAGLGLVPTDDWEPPKLHRGVGVRVAVLLLILLAAAAVVGAYFYVWKPEMLRAREEEARTSQLAREQAEHEASARAAETRAKDELLKSLAAASAQDGGSRGVPDGGLGPRGALDVPPAEAPSTADARLPAPAVLAAPLAAASLTGQSGEPSGDEDGMVAMPPAGPASRGAPQTFEEWMAEADRRRTHERAAAALAAYDKALSLKPQRSQAHAGRGLALLDLGRRPEALGEFQRALELDPRDGVAVLGLAEAYRSLGRSEEARRAYQRYLNGWPAGAEARAARAALESLKE